MTRTELPATAPLASAEWVQQHLDDPGVRLIDASVGVAFDDGVRRWVNGSESFGEAHLPGAQRADLLGAFSGPGDGDFELPEAAAFAEAAGLVGVGDDTLVVVYDDSSTTWATRVWWLFKHFGHERVLVLDGGLGAWRAAGGALETGLPAVVERAVFTPAERAGDVVSTEALRELREQPGTLVVSALPPKDFSGEKSPRPRAGRIPGSINIPAGSLLDPATGTLLPKEQLAVRLAPVLEAEGEPVLHCGAGVSATLPLLALELLGRPDVVLYEESLNVWAADPANPLESDTP